MIRMKALRQFSRTIRGQIYYGDPKHPNEENGQRFTARNEADAKELEDGGYAKRVQTRELDEGDEPVTGEQQALVGKNETTDVAAAAAANAGFIAGTGEDTGDADRKPEGVEGPIPQGGLTSTATDNHSLDHTTQRAGNARGTPAVDAAPRETAASKPARRTGRRARTTEANATGKDAKAARKSGGTAADTGGTVGGAGAGEGSRTAGATGETGAGRTGGTAGGDTAPKS